MKTINIEESEAEAVQLAVEATNEFAIEIWERKDTNGCPTFNGKTLTVYEDEESLNADFLNIVDIESPATALRLMPLIPYNEDYLGDLQDSRKNSPEKPKLTLTIKQYTTQTAAQAYCKKINATHKRRFPASQLVVNQLDGNVFQVELLLFNPITEIDLVGIV